MKLDMSLGVCALVLGVSLARAQIEIPDTPVERNVSAMLAALNSGDRDVVAGYVADYGRGESVDDVMRASEQLGALTLVEIIASEPLRMQFVVRAASGLRLLAFLEVEDADPPHVAFSLPWIPVPPGATILGFDINASVRSQVVERLTGSLSQSYAIEETAQRMAAAIDEHYRDGDYDDIRNGWVFANRLTQDLQAISRDKHLVVSFSPIANGPPVRNPNAVESIAASQANCGFGQSEILARNVGYVKINEFVDPGRCAAKAVEVLTPLVGVGALVFDLRDAVGGARGDGYAASRSAVRRTDGAQCDSRAKPGIRPATENGSPLSWIGLRRNPGLRSCFGTDLFRGRMVRLRASDVEAGVHRWRSHNGRRTCGPTRAYR